MDSADERVTLNICQGFGCHEKCIVETHSKDGKIARIQKAPLPGREPGCRVCPKGIMNAKIPYTENRLLYPLKRKGERGSGEWEQISWDQALDEISAKMKDCIEEYGPKSIIVNTMWCGLPGQDRSTNFDLSMRFIQSLDCTRFEFPDVDLALIYAAVMDMGGVYSNNKYLLNKTESEIIIWGSNPIGFTRPSEITTMLINARQRGVKLVHISNMFDVTSAKVDEWVPVKSGTDAALALGMANVLLSDGAYDSDFLVNRTTAAYLVRDDNGQYLTEADIQEGGDPAKYVLVDEATGEPFTVGKEIGKSAGGAISSQVGLDLSDEDLDGNFYGDHQPKLEAAVSLNGIGAKTVFAKLREHLAKWTPESQEAVTGVPAAQCIKLARDLWKATPAMIFVNDGFRYMNGTQIARSVYLLAYLTGNFGKGGGNMLPAPVDFDPMTGIDIMPFWFSKPMTDADQQTVPAVLASFEDPEEQQYKVFINPYSNPLTNWPNRDLWLNKLLPNFDLFVAIDIRMTDTCRYADYVLPEATIFERYEVLPGPNDCIILNEPAIEPCGETRDAALIWKGLADRLGIGEYFYGSMKEWAQFKVSLMQNAGALIEDRDAGGEIAPLTWERLEAQKYLHYPVADEPYDNYDGITFGTQSGKIEFYAAPFAAIGSAFADYQPAFIHDEEVRREYPLQFYPGRHKYFMQSQFTNVPELVKLAKRTQTGVALNPQTAAERGLREGDEVEVFNQRGSIRTHLHLRQDIPPKMAHMWYSFDETEYPGTNVPQVLATPLNTPLTNDNIILFTSLGMNQMYDSIGAPRSARFVVEKGTAEVFWDTLCDVRKAE